MSPSRRRQRSTRAVVAVALVGLGVLAVVGAAASAAVLSQGASVVVLLVAAVVAALAGAAAVRIVFSELARTRRDWARDRAGLARVHRDETADRLAEQATFARVMTERLTEREHTIVELRGVVRLAEARHTDAERRLRVETRRAEDLRTAFRELKTARADPATVEEPAAAWHGADIPTIVDLLAWEQSTATLAHDQGAREA